VPFPKLQRRQSFSAFSVTGEEAELEADEAMQLHILYRTISVDGVDSFREGRSLLGVSFTQEAT